MKPSTLLSALAVAAFLTGAAPRSHLSVTGGPAVVGAQERERINVGVMRRDGVLVPFAAYDGDWSAPWPGSVRGMELPITLDAIPKKWWGDAPPDAWTLVRGVGRPPVDVKPSAPLAVPVGVDMRLGVRTDFRSSEELPPLFEFPYPKEGLAVAGNVKVEPVAGISRLAAAWRELPVTLRAVINAAEQKTIHQLKSNAQWTHPVPRELRERMPAELEAWYTSMLEQPGFSVSYIEAVKKYPPGPQDDDDCGLETFVTGWVHSNVRDPQAKADLTARVTYCDRKGVAYMLPLGRLRVRNRTHWVFQISGWDREWYSVVEATPGKIRYVVEYYAGGRPPV